MYDDLPPPTAPKAASRDEDENDDDDVDDGRDVKRARLSTKADEGASGDVDDKARDDAAVDVQAPAATTTTTDDALRRIAQHLLKPEKFVKASGVLRKLLLSDACGRSESKALFACLENAMSPPTRALRRETRIDYEDLFEVVAAFAPLVFNAKQKRKVEKTNLQNGMKILF